MQLHPQEALLQQARALQQSEAFAGYRAGWWWSTDWRGWSNWESVSPATSAASKLNQSQGEMRSSIG